MHNDEQMVFSHVLEAGVARTICSLDQSVNRISGGESPWTTGQICIVYPQRKISKCAVRFAIVDAHHHAFPTLPAHRYPAVPKRINAEKKVLGDVTNTESLVSNAVSKSSNRKGSSGSEARC